MRIAGLDNLIGRKENLGLTSVYYSISFF